MGDSSVHGKKNCTDRMTSNLVVTKISCDLTWALTK